MNNENQLLNINPSDIVKEGQMRLWTITSDYFGTGEGRTIQALITYAENEQEAIEKFSKTFNEFWARGALAHEGINENEIVQYLFSPTVLNEAKAMEGNANLELFGQFHFNFS